MDDSGLSVLSPFFLSIPSILKTTLTYELIDNASGRTLIAGPNPHATLLSAAQYILDYNVDYKDVAYIVLKNYKEPSQRGVLDKARAIIFAATGDELRELIEDEQVDPYADTTLDDWESDGGMYFEDLYDYDG